MNTKQLKMDIKLATTLLVLLVIWDLSTLPDANDLQCPRKPRKLPKELRIGAFNIQNLGAQKMSKPEITDVLVKVLSKYHLIFIQEIVDRNQEVIDQLVEKLNSGCGTNVYSFSESERVGRTNQKEQYAYVYSKNYLNLVNAYIYNDVNDEFEREPYIATFDIVNSDKDGLSQFTVVGIHTKPSDAVKEIQNLDHVVQNLERQGHSDIVLLGDFNADCSYVRKKNWKDIQLWTNDKYDWLIQTKTDTTATDSKCAYDRIVLSGSRMKNAVIRHSAGPVRYDEELGLSSEQAQAVSDHYPIQFRIRLS